MSTKQKVRRALAEYEASKVAPPTVAVGFIYGQDVAAGFCTSLSAMLWAQGSRRDHRIVVDVLAESSGVNISAGRNEIMRRFLRDTTADYLLIIDADMTFAPDLPDALLACANADPESEHFAPIVGGLCFGIDKGKLFPTLYGFMPDGDGVKTVRYETFPRDTMFQVGATGAACLLIHRSVVEKVGGEKFNAVYPWFQETELGGERCGEDVTFCLRAARCGFPIYVHTGVPVGHQKTQVLNIDAYREQRGHAGLKADVDPVPQEV